MDVDVSQGLLTFHWSERLHDLAAKAAEVSHPILYWKQSFDKLSRDDGKCPPRCFITQEG